MNPEIFAEWMRRQGLTVYRTESSYWHSQGPRAYQGFPYHWLIQPQEEEIQEFLRRINGIALRYSTPLNSKYGHISYHAVLEGNLYGIETLGKWARKNVKRGLNNCNVEPMSFDQLAKEGWNLQKDTLDRQGRELNISSEVWQKRCLAAKDLPGFEAWGAFTKTGLAASVITFQMEDCIYMLYQQCLREYLQEHVNNALSFIVTQSVLSRPEIHSILYGLHSLDAPPSVDEFKFRMGYQAKPVRQRVVFNPLLSPFFNKVSHFAMGKALKVRPGDPFLAKTEGMVRFHLQGKLPLSKQDWPEVLLDQKDIILSGDCKF